MRTEPYAICLLAGGQARRMGGGDKGEIKIEGQTIITRMMAQFSQAPYLFLNANGNTDRLAHYGLDIIGDLLPDHQGPLSGIYAAMCHLQQTRPDCKWLLSLPTDAPLLPPHLDRDLLAFATQTKADIVSVSSHGRTHPVIALWSLDLTSALHHALIEEGVRKIDAFTAGHDCHYLDYDGTPDPFMNLNRPQDVTAFQASLSDK
ncbi:MAG: molybdenum cofactor guanylyltransferase MobA [Candidatus Puniceispirillaceae bacterium]